MRLPALYRDSRYRGAATIANNMLRRPPTQDGYCKKGGKWSPQRESPRPSGHIGRTRKKLSRPCKIPLLLPLEVRLGGGLKNVINGYRFHANIVPARTLPVVISINARAARNLHPDWNRPGSKRSKQKRRLGSEQRDHRYRCHGCEMGRAAIICNQ